MSDYSTSQLPVASPPGAPDMEPNNGESYEVFDAPPVVAVVVAYNPGEQFAEMLGSLGNQTYENLSVLVIDAGSDEPIADRVAKVLPDAYLHRLTGDPGWSVAANQSMELVSGSPFLLFCHDDVALSPDCLQTLMDEMYEHNGGIVGPKLVDWHDHRKMLQLGMNADRFGVLVEHIERGEFDQDQYEEVKEAFVVPGGVQLVRADLFAALDGFDSAINAMGEDLDLCWRAHALGATTMVVSTAQARHLESMDSRITARQQHKLLTRHRLRTLLITGTDRGRRTRNAMAVALILLEAFYYLMSGRRGQARDTVSALWWNLSRSADVRRRRRTLRQIRTVSEKDIRSIQLGGSASLNSFSRGQLGVGQGKLSGFFGAVRASFQGEDSGSLRDATVVGLLLVTILAFASRHLLTRDIAAVGQIPIVPDAGTLFSEWWTGWRSAGTAGPASAPNAFILIGLLRLVTFWSDAAFTRMLVAGPLFLGAFTSYRLARPLGSPRAAAVAALFYATSPLVVSAYSAARWESLVAFAAAPALVGSLLRLSNISPFGTSGGEPGLRIVKRSLPVLALRYGVLVALVVAIVPAMLIPALVLALAFALGSMLGPNRAGPKPFLLAGLVAVAATVGLHFPWSFDVVGSFSWRWFVGPQSPERSVGGFIDLILFSPGAPGLWWSALGLVVVALVSVLYTRPRYLGFVVQAWLGALATFMLLWSERRGWLPYSLPVAETMLTVALACLALVAAIGIRSAELEPPTRWPSLVLRATFGVAIVAAAMTGMWMTFDGYLRSPSNYYSKYSNLLTPEPGTEIRTLWLGDASVMPVDVAVSATGVQYAITNGVVPDMTGRWTPGPVGQTARVGAYLDLARSGETIRLGRLLAPHGIKVIVVIDQLAPAPYEGPQISPGEGVEDSLSQQLDLQRVIGGIPNLTVFRNQSASGLASELPGPAALEAVTPTDQLEVDIGSSAAVPVETVAPGRWKLQASGEAPILLSVPSDGLAVNGSEGLILSGFDGLTIVPAQFQGELEVSYLTPVSRRAALILQFGIVASGVIIAQTRREEVVL